MKGSWALGMQKSLCYPLLLQQLTFSVPALFSPLSVNVNNPCSADGCAAYQTLQSPLGLSPPGASDAVNTATGSSRESPSAFFFFFLVTLLRSVWPLLEVEH